MAAPPQTLEALVRDELRQPVAALVRQVVVELVSAGGSPGSPGA